MEGSVWSSAYNTALTNVGKNELFKQMAVAGIFYHLYNQVSPTQLKRERCCLANSISYCSQVARYLVMQHWSTTLCLAHH